MNQMSRTGKLLANPWLGLGIRIALGTMFIVSAQSKLPHHTEFVQVVKSYDLLPEMLATAYGNALPWVELLVGVYLLLGILLRFSSVVSLLMAISFMVANIDALTQGNDYCGHCFGELTTLPVEQAIIIDAFVLIGSTLLILFTPAYQHLSLERIVNRRRVTMSEESE